MYKVNWSVLEAIEGRELVTVQLLGGLVLRRFCAAIGEWTNPTAEGFVKNGQQDDYDNDDDNHAH